MLTKKERGSVMRALNKAYYKYRDLTIRQICREERILVVKLRHMPFGGEYSHLGNGLRDINPEDSWYVKYLLERKRYSEAKKETRRVRFVSRFEHRITIPWKSLSAEKEDTWWHEVGHLVISRYFPAYVGYHDYLHSFTPDNWEHERLVDAFATAMMLYRNGLEPNLKGGTFFFEDAKSLCYTQMSRFNAVRIKEYCDQAREVRRNIDLRRLTTLVECLEKQGMNPFLGLQPDLPMEYEDTHRESLKVKYGLHFVDWEEDQKRNQQHTGKESWREAHPKEQKLMKEMRTLSGISENRQLALFEENTQADEAEFKRRVERLDKAVKKYTNG